MASPPQPADPRSDSEQPGFPPDAGGTAEFRKAAGALLSAPAPESGSHPDHPKETVAASSGGEAADFVPRPGLAAGTGPVLPHQELLDEVWEDGAGHSWWRLWLRGWRLLLLILLLGGAYAAWRGGADYRALKTWRARSIARKAIHLVAGGGADEEAQTMLNQAATLAPGDPEVLRAMADFCEPRKDPMALYALRQLTRSGAAEPADWERLCRLSFDWEHPELVPEQMLSYWASAPVEQLSPGQVKYASRWLANRGMAQESETRLRHALKHWGSRYPELDIALASMVLSAPGEGAAAEKRVKEGLSLLGKVAEDGASPIPARTDAARLMAAILLNRNNRALLTPVHASQLKRVFRQLATLPNAQGALANELAAVSVEIAEDGSRRDSLIAATVARAETAPPEERLVIARWLGDNGAFREVLALCNLTTGAAAAPDWFTLRLTALLTLNEPDTAAGLLNAQDQPLTPVIRQWFLYRIDRIKNAGESDLKQRREQLSQAADAGPAPDVLKVAADLEKSRDYPTAHTLYQKLNNDERAGLQARLGSVRCLDAIPDRHLELIQALESVLQTWPHLQDARSDLIYLRLLDGKAEDTDRKQVRDLAQHSPWYLAYRVTAALSELQTGQPAEALALLERDPVPWAKVRPGWQAVYAAVLAANNRMDEARAIAVRLLGKALRPGEMALLKQFQTGGP